MKYDFTTVLDRRGRDSTAADVIPFKGFQVDEGFSPIPMWIADMSFKAAPAVMDAIYRRMEMPNFGYFPLPKEYFDSIIRWQQRRNSVEGLLPEHIGYENGVLGGVSSALQAFTAPGEEVLVHSPTYVGFTHTFQDTGRVAVHSPLKRDEQGIWRMDYEDMDRKIKEHNIHLAIFCSPHNPCGRVWERREIERAMEVYAANNCLVISDEIWSDIIMPGYKHIPTQSVSEDAKKRTIAFYAPSKTFSLAGLVGSYHIIYNKYLRERVLRQSRLSHYNDPNVLSVHALIGGFSPEGGLGRRDDTGGKRQPGLCLRLHPGQFPRREGDAPPGHLHALSGLRGLLPQPRHKHLSAPGAGSGLRGHLAERRGLHVPRLHTHELCPAPLPGGGGHGAAEEVCVCLRNKVNNSRAALETVEKASQSFFAAAKK